MPFNRVERASRLSGSFLKFIAFVRHLLRGRPLLPRGEKVYGAARSRSGSQPEARVYVVDNAERSVRR